MTNDEWTVSFKVPKDNFIKGKFQDLPIEEYKLGKGTTRFNGLYIDEYGLMAGILNRRSKLVEPTYILKWDKK